MDSYLAGVPGRVGMVASMLRLNSLPPARVNNFETVGERI